MGIQKLPSLQTQKFAGLWQTMCTTKVLYSMFCFILQMISHQTTGCKVYCTIKNITTYHQADFLPCSVHDQDGSTGEQAELRRRIFIADKGNLRPWRPPDSVHIHAMGPLLDADRLREQRPRVQQRRIPHRDRPHVMSFTIFCLYGSYPHNVWIRFMG